MFAVVYEEEDRVVYTSLLGAKGSQDGRGIYNKSEDAAEALYEFSAKFPKKHYCIVPATRYATPILICGVEQIDWELDRGQMEFIDDWDY